MVDDNNEFNRKYDDDNDQQNQDDQINQQNKGSTKNKQHHNNYNETLDDLYQSYPESNNKPQQEFNQNTGSNYSSSEEFVQSNSKDISLGGSNDSSTDEDNNDVDSDENDSRKQEDWQYQKNNASVKDIEINKIPYSNNDDIFSPASLPRYRWDSNDSSPPGSPPPPPTSFPGDDDEGSSKWKKITAIAIAIILPAGLAAVGFLGVGSYVGDDSSLSDPDASVKGGGPPGYNDGTNPQGQNGHFIPPGVGEIGSDHAHAAIRTIIDGSYVDFGMPRFQLKSEYIHFENQNSYLIHRHAGDVPLSVLFESVNIEIKDAQGCFVVYASSLKAKKKEFCQDSDHILRFYVNDKEVSNISDYVIEHGDRILIYYGEDKQGVNEKIEDQLESLNSLEIYDIPKDNKKDGKRKDDGGRDQRDIQRGKNEIMV